MSLLINPYRFAVAAGGGAYSSAVLADSPAAYYRLGEASGTTMLDSSGNGRDGAYVGSPTLGVAGLLTSDTDTAVSLNGSSQYANVTSATWMETAEFTIEALVKPTALAANKPIAARHALSGFRWDLLAHANGSLVFRTAIGGGAAAPAGTLTVGTKAHVVGRRAAGVNTLWVNGVLVASKTEALTVAAQGMSIGALTGGYSVAPWSGTIDEFAYYGTALVDARIAAHYAAV